MRIIDDHEVCDMQIRAEIKRADKAEAELDRAYERYDQAEKDRNHWHDKAQEYKQRCDEWQDTYMELVEERDLPRIITADEVREGQHYIVAWKREYDFQLWLDDVRPISSENPTETTIAGEGGWISKDEVKVIVLLEEAPDKPKFAEGGKVEYRAPKPDYPDNPWFATVYEDAPYWAGTWRGTPVRPQSINRGDLYDIHTAHGSAITGILAARNGIHRPQSGDQYRLVNRAT